MANCPTIITRNIQKNSQKNIPTNIPTNISTNIPKNIPTNTSNNPLLAGGAAVCGPSGQVSFGHLTLNITLNISLFNIYFFIPPESEY